MQIKYRLYYFIKFTFQQRRLPLLKKPIEAKSITLSPSLSVYSTYFGNNTFIFLNIIHHFESKIDWNLDNYGKLWTYNLNYFEFLLQTDISVPKGRELIHDFIQNESKLKDGLEPYPIAVRSICWIKFLVKNQIEDKEINTFLYRQLQLLSQQLEYHLLGNHLFENGFGLLFGAYYFADKQFYRIANKILREQLNEQILADGAHFELSPMYHQIILFRVLDSVNLIENNKTVFPNNDFDLLKEKAALMLGWLQQMTFQNGDIPHLNDSANNISPNTKALLQYGKQLKILPSQMALKESGYRKYVVENYEMVVDVGNIGPDYIPGHAHSDTFSFVLYHKNLPIIVDTGTSTYEKNELRQKERSTSSHNTVQISNFEQSEIWGGFRVGRRAKVTILEETENSIEAFHDGYSHLNIQHSRQFSFYENEIVIKDVLSQSEEATAYLHFHPNTKLMLKDNVLISEFGKIIFQNASSVSLKSYNYAEGFNLQTKATKAEITFSEKLHTSIYFL